jgi:hypothetical protein
MQHIHSLVQALHLTYCFQASPPDSLPLGSYESLNRSGSKNSNIPSRTLPANGSLQKTNSTTVVRLLTLLPPKAAPISAPLVPTFTFDKDKYLAWGKQKNKRIITLTIPVSDPLGPIHFPTFRMSRVHRLDDKPWHK